MGGRFKVFLSSFCCFKKSTARKKRKHRPGYTISMIGVIFGLFNVITALFVEAIFHLAGCCCWWWLLLVVVVLWVVVVVGGGGWWLLL